MVDGFLPSSITMKSVRQESPQRRDTIGISTRLLVSIDAGANSDAKGKPQVLETLWSYVDNLQKSRKTKGEIKAVYSLANFLESNTFQKELMNEKENGHGKLEIQISSVTSDSILSQLHK